MNSCPKCGGTEGARFIALERNVYIMGWNGECECVDGEAELGRTMPECLGCGHRFRWSTIEQKQEATNGQE